MPLLDTHQGRDLTGTLIADIVLQLLSYVAQTEREFIRQRQAEGIAAAKAKGVRFERRALEKPAEFENICAKWVAGKLSSRVAAQQLNVSQQTFLNWSKEFAKKVHYNRQAMHCVLHNNMLKYLKFFGQLTTAYLGFSLVPSIPVICK